MGLRDFFAREPSEPKRPQTVPLGDALSALQSALHAQEFWEAVRSNCGQHVDRMIDLFRGNNWPRMDWAEPRFRALVTAQTLNEVTTQAQQSLKDIRSGGGIGVRSAGVVDSWLIMVSAFPSASDSDFLKACKNSSYDNFAQSVRSEFRTHTQGWECLDFAHWILLVDQQADEVAIHLHTIWNVVEALNWIVPQPDGKPPALIPAPVIVPIELAADAESMVSQMWRDDIAAYRKLKTQ